MVQNLVISFHNRRARGHLHKAWNVSSHSIPHKAHMSEISSFRLCLFSRVAKEFVATRHANTRTFRGAGHPHTAFQTAHVPSGALLMAHMKVLVCPSRAVLYALRTLKMPRFSGAQARMSSRPRGLALIVHMHSTSGTVKCCYRRSTRHRPFPSRCSDTRRSRHVPRGVIGL
jgi:hypothetical protein